MKIIDLARAYAEHMDGWRAEPLLPADHPRSGVDGAVLVHDDTRARLVIERGHPAPRLIVYPDLPYRSDVSGPVSKSISVNADRAPGPVARDILRRAVPAAIEGTRQWEANIARAEEREARQRALRDEIAAEFPILQPWQGSEPRFDWRPANADDDDARTRGTIKLRTHHRYNVLAGTFKEDGHRGDVELHGLTVDQVRRVLHALTGATLWLVSVEHRHGTNESLHLSEADAKMAVLGHVEESWDTDGPGGDIPEDPDAAITAYFNAAADEWYSVSEFPFPGAN